MQCLYVLIAPNEKQHYGAYWKEDEALAESGRLWKEERIKIEIYEIPETWIKK